MKTNRRELWTVVILTMAGMALRIADLTGRSLWIDESLTLARLAGTWQEILRNTVIMQGIATTDLHPPLYFVIEKAWGYFAGNSEFALKLVPAFASILLIPATYVLGRRLFSGRVALIAALLALLSPAYQWYGHELRMYTVVPLLAALSNYSLYAALGQKKTSVYWWVTWILVTACALLTHYSLFALFGAQLVYLCLAFFYKRPRISRRDLALVGVVVIIILTSSFLVGIGTDIFFRARQLLRGFDNPDVSVTPFGDIVLNVFNSMLFGQNATDPTGAVFTWFVVIVAAAGLTVPFMFDGDGAKPRKSIPARVFLGLVSIVPMLVVLLYALIEHSPSFRYSILAVPAIHVVLASVFSAALVSLRRVRIAPFHFQYGKIKPYIFRAATTAVGITALVSVFAAQTFGLAFTFIRTPSWQDDWRGMAQYMKDNWQPGDLFLITLYTPEDEMRILLKGVPIDIQPIHALPDADAARLQYISKYKRIWFSNTGGGALNRESSNGRVLLDLHLRRKLSFPSQTNVLELMLFDVASTVSDSPPATAQRVTGTGVVSGNPSIAAYDIQPGDPYNRYANMRLSLYWRRPENNQALNDYSVSVRIVTADRRVWADWFLTARLEEAPPDWSSDNLYHADYVVPLPIGLPSQSYQLVLALGKGDKAEVYSTIVRPVASATVQCCIRILRWPASTAAQDNSALWRTSGAMLKTVEFPSAVMPGEILPVVLTWQLSQPAVSSWQTVVRLEGLLGGSVAESAAPAGTDEAPVTTWPVGEPERTMQSMQLPFTVKPGFYRLTVQRIFTTGLSNDGTLLGIVQVTGFPFTPVATDIPNPVEGKVGELQLLGYSLDRAIERNVTLSFHLYWRVLEQPARDGVLFLHVIGPDGKMAAQDDNPPDQGKRSTVTYRPGEGIDQLHRLVIPGDAPGGNYRLYAGIYDRGSQERWPAQQAGTPAQDNLLYLGTLNLPALTDYSDLRQHVFIPLVLNGN
ncbi:MAG: glycosyltransferase family 39 protein [Chloroflexi bacterium]|nr:glycosyltransferase family 39 protein [Chloroflexota bacterium]MCL5274179.1 glycosyltransferase family 39 protein [Chloroflexota bacterium]